MCVYIYFIKCKIFGFARPAMFDCLMDSPLARYIMMPITPPQIATDPWSTARALHLN